MSPTKEKKQKVQEEKLAVAYLNALKSSPLKVMKLTRNLPGLPVAEVLMKLKFCN